MFGPVPPNCTPSDWNLYCELTPQFPLANGFKALSLFSLLNGFIKSLVSSIRSNPLYPLPANEPSIKVSWITPRAEAVILIEGNKKVSPSSYNLASFVTLNLYALASNSKSKKLVTALAANNLLSATSIVLNFSGGLFKLGIVEEATKISLSLPLCIRVISPDSGIVLSSKKKLSGKSIVW